MVSKSVSTIYSAFILKKSVILSPDSKFFFVGKLDTATNLYGITDNSCFFTCYKMLKLRKGHLRSTMKEELLDNLDHYFPKIADHIQLYVL